MAGMVLCLFLLHFSGEHSNCQREPNEISINQITNGGHNADLDQWGMESKNRKRNLYRKHDLVQCCFTLQRRADSFTNTDYRQSSQTIKWTQTNMVSKNKITHDGDTHIL